ncbi:MAG TPA: type II toxin-antitoxin system HicB family antitoxin [Candidatus Kapabacteria bacterium]|nr:type II toxin-antitoxin system HicB family antitoxin [Candidatus Kapabacteria bacterium]
MKEYEYIIWREGNYYVSQCLNVNVSSFGESYTEAQKNLKEAVELYFEDEQLDLPEVYDISIGKDYLYV